MRILVEKASFIPGANIYLLDIHILSGKAVLIGDNYVNAKYGYSFIVTALPTGTYDFDRDVFTFGISTSDEQTNKFENLEFEKV